MKYTRSLFCVNQIPNANGCMANAAAARLISEGTDRSERASQRNQ